MAKKILICDDDMEVAQMAAKRLKSEGYDVVLAFDGVQAVQTAHRENPDLILLDIQMPGGGGALVHENLQRSIYTKTIPIILFSALDPDLVKEKASLLNVADYISKPYESSELLEKIAKCI